MSWTGRSPRPWCPARKDSSRAFRAIPAVRQSGFAKVVTDYATLGWTCSSHLLNLKWQNGLKRASSLGKREITIEHNYLGIEDIGEPDLQQPSTDYPHEPVGKELAAMLV